MKKFDMNQSVWYERYKPQLIDDLIIPQALRDSLNKGIKQQTIPNIGIFSSLPGTGKSSTANAIVRELNGEALWINASKEKGIDTLRGKIAKFASQSSFDGNIKVVVMDEFDYFSPDGQAAFRGFLDEFSSNCRFIFTGNYKEKIIEPLLDRMECYDYNAFPKEEQIKPIFERLRFILDNENVQYDPKDLVPVINTYYPRIRSMIGFLQKCSSGGVLDVSLGDIDEVSALDEVMKLASPRTYLEMVSAVNKLNAPDNMFGFLYRNASKYFRAEAYPTVIVTIAKYQHMASSVRDKNLNLAACLTELLKLVQNQE